MLIITVQFTVKPENRKKIINMSRILVEQTLREEGCIAYSFFEDHYNPNKFMFFERWKNREAVNIHFEKPYVKTYSDVYSSLREGKAKLEIHEIKQTNTV
ncbi:MAG: antibiotic biosynthesis monooxygenase [Rhizobiales bacterium]|nr:antibiotic biosynthesis monooxygenase [Hyphomicrobiales bacterium]NRB15333.1 antibiotic biosynthesis monooxygenase [Hyphomicrobiales bacterium]